MYKPGCTDELHACSAEIKWKTKKLFIKFYLALF